VFLAGLAIVSPSSEHGDAGAQDARASRQIGLPVGATCHEHEAGRRPTLRKLARSATFVNRVAMHRRRDADSFAVADNVGLRCPTPRNESP
jgi:hypothetical protein